MALTVNQDIKVIQRKDEDFPKDLQFEALRQVGLKHIGDLSGKIWTDHNVHDPGITILEMLCYALMDLGYRSRLPIEDILAKSPLSHVDVQNFFTPAHALSGQPTSILDYRRLLLDLPGVQNVWLDVEWGDDALLPLPTGPILLNGLYRITLQLEPFNPSDLDDTEDSFEAYSQRILEEVNQKLQAFRNLGEDFILDICVLKEQPVGICGDITFEEGADPEEAYVNMLDKLDEYFSPRLNFYTLGEMLAKDKPIEEIYAGRPYLKESHGFVDVDELEQLTLRKEIHLSDIYHVIQDVPGIANVKNLKIKLLPSDNLPTVQIREEWVVKLPKDTVAVFSPIDPSSEDYKLNFHRSGASYQLKEEEVERLMGERLSLRKKVLYQQPHEALDKQLPEGFYRKDLGSYYSIQHEFPRVFGIGEGGLPPNATDLRKAQALQLKGYLLFFERLLADFLAQLSNVGNLFSLTPEHLKTSESRRTYFAQELTSVPEEKKLNRMKADWEALGWFPGRTLASPISPEDFDVEGSGYFDPKLNSKLYDTYTAREVAITRLCQAMADSAYSLSTFYELGFPEGFKFVFHLHDLPLLLVSDLTYPTEKDALNAASLLASLAVQPGVYRRNIPHQQDEGLGEGEKYTYELAFAPPDNLGYLHQILESPETYTRRRHQFLDHLLARFGEDFTDYVLIRYTLEGHQAETKQSLIKDKSNFLSRADLFARERNKAYDQCAPVWNTENISGFEKRLAGLTGMDYSKRISLNPFDFFQYGDNFQFQLPAPPTAQISNYLLKNREGFGYGNQKHAREAINMVWAKLREGGNIRPSLREGGYAMHINHPLGSAIFAEVFANDKVRDLEIQRLDQLFRKEAIAENVVVSKYEYHLRLDADHGEALPPEIQSFERAKAVSSETRALAGANAFVTELNKAKPRGRKASKTEVKLVPNPHRSNGYINLKQVESAFKLSEARFRWSLEIGKGLSLLSHETFTSEEEAKLDFLNEITSGKEALDWKWDGEMGKLDKGDRTIAGLKVKEGEQAYVEEWLKHEKENGTFIQQVNKAYQWQLLDENGVPQLLAPVLFSEKKLAENKTTWKTFKAAGQKKGNYQLNLLENGNFEVQLLSADGGILAHSPAEGLTAEGEKELLEGLITLFKRQTNAKGVKLDTAYRFVLPDFEELESVLIQSNNAYRSYEEAWAAFESLFQLASRKNGYDKTDDERKKTFTWGVLDKGGEYHAFDPQEYETIEERDAAFDKTKNLLQKSKIPLQSQAEYAYFICLKNQKPFLQSSNWFATERQAFKDFEQTVCFALDPVAYAQDREDSPLGRNIQGQLPNELDAQFYSSSSNSKERQGEIDQFLSEYQASLYSLSVVKTPVEWVYQYYRPDPTKSPEDPDAWTKFLVSTPRSDFEDAQTSYQSFLAKAQLPTEWEVKEEKKKDKWRFLLVKSRQHYVASDWFDQEADMLVARNSFLNERAYVNDLDDRILSTASLPQAYIQNVTGDPFVYRAYKKESPLAICKESKANPGPISQHDLFHHTRLAKGYLKIVQSEFPIVKIEDRYHYQIVEEGEEQPIFVSYKGYPSTAEAQKAFHQFLVQIFHYATFERYYPQGLEQTALTKISFSPATFSDLDCESDLDPLVFVPQQFQNICMGREPDQNGDVDFEKLREKLMILAGTFPIRIALYELGESHLCHPCSIKDDPRFDEKRYALSAKDEIELIPTGPKKYYFQLPLKEDEFEKRWIGVERFETAQEAHDAFCQFLEVVKVESSYGTWDDDRGDWHCELDARLQFFYPEGETEAESMEGTTEEVLSEDQVELEKRKELLLGNPSSTHSCLPEPCGTYQAIYKIILEGKTRRKSVGTDTSGNPIPPSTTLWSDIHELVSYTVERDHFVSYYDQVDQCYRFCVVAEDYKLLEHPIHYHDQEERDHALGWMNINFDLTQIDEAKDLKYCCVTPGKWKFYIYGELEGERQIIWRSCHSFDSKAEAEDAFDLLKTSSAKYNLRSRQVGDCGPFTFDLVDPDKELAINPNCFDSYEDLKAGMEEAYACLNQQGFYLIEHILLRPKLNRGNGDDKSEEFCWLDTLPDQSCDLYFDPFDEEGCDKPEQFPHGYDEENGMKYIPHADPYSFVVTLVFPDWPSLLHVEHYRQFVQNKVLEELPAHIVPCFTWLPPEKMQDFERIYRKFTELMCVACMPVDKADPAAPALDPLLKEKLNECICELQDCMSHDPQRERSLRLKFAEPQRPSIFLPVPTRKKETEELIEEGLQPKGLGEVPPPSTFKPRESAIPTEAKEEKQLDEREKDRAIQQRLAKYQEEMQAIGDSQLQKTQSFNRIKLFLQSPGSLDAFEALTNYLIRYGLGKKESKNYQDFLQLLGVSFRYYLDRVLFSAEEIPSDKIASVMRKLVENELDMKKVKKDWRKGGLSQMADKGRLGKMNKALKA